MSYVEKHLIEGETIIYETRLHWIVLIAPVVLGLLFALTGVGMFVLSGRASADQATAHQSLMAIGAAFFLVALIFIVRGVVMRNEACFREGWTRRAKNHRAPPIKSRKHRRRRKRDGENARLRHGDRPRNRWHA
jgi:hypothetical protein